MMILDELKNWAGTVEIDGTTYARMTDVKRSIFDGKQSVHIVLHPVQKQAINSPEMGNSKQFRITVKKYMTQKATADFDFMEKWNNNVPMPLRTMTGTVEKETRGMVYMKLHGEGRPTITCIRCGRELTNPVSRKYGIGPECITHFPMLAKYAVDDVAGIKEQLTNMTWEGWIIKSAITESEEL